MKKNKVALITGITGQDGSYLAEFLLHMGYEVHGMIRRSSAFNTQRIDHIYQDPHVKERTLFLHYGNLADGGRISNLVSEIQPDEIYHLAAMSQVRVSFDMPEYTGNVTGLGVTRMLEAIRHNCPTAKFYNAASSEIWGASLPPQDENTLFRPKSTYACSKAYAHWMTENYRKGYNIFACSGTLGNHESPRSGETFVTRKITVAITNILKGRQDFLYLGNLEAKRDWGFCYDNKTEILTNFGWKLFKDLNYKDEVATLNKEGYLEYKIPSKIIERKYNKKMIVFQNRHLDLVVTPNHNMYVKNIKKNNYELLEAEEVFKSINKWKFKKDAFWQGKEMKYFLLPSIVKYKNKRIESSLKLNMDDWLEFLGWRISEGCTGNGKRGDYRVSISQTFAKVKYRVEIEDCLKKLNFKYRVTEKEFIIQDKQLWNYLKQFGKSKDMYVPLFIKTLDKRQIMIFLNSLFKGDGNGKIDINKNCNFYTSSKRLIDDVQELLLKCGLSGNVRQHKNRKDAYRINIISQYNNPSFRGNSNSILKQVDYNGKIYCCTVPNHIIYVRRNGKGCWCGNSPEYVEQIWKMLQLSEPVDLVLGTGESHSVLEFLKEAFSCIGLNHKTYLKQDKNYLRPLEIDELRIDAKKAKKLLDWQPKIKFKELVGIMVDADMQATGLRPNEPNSIIKKKFPNKWWKGD